MDDANRKYAPLTAEEREAAAEEVAPPADGCEHVCPVPEDAPPPPPTFGDASATWAYTDVAGAVLFYVCRFDKPDGKKDVMPLTLWNGPGGLTWRWKDFPGLRPLYGLDRLAGLPDATVIVCEGEKAADAAQRIFTDYVAVTSPGGSNASHKADWSPLRGRTVLIWPDNDAAGNKYAAAVGSKLHGLGCNVRIIDAAALVGIDGGNRGDVRKVGGWDAADAESEWQDQTALREAVISLIEPAPVQPAFVSYGLFRMDSSGLWHDKTRVSAPFEIVGRVRNSRGEQWARLLRWTDKDGRTHNEIVNDTDLHGDPAPLARKLADGGLHIETGRGARESLIAYINGSEVEARVTIVDRAGWHEVAGHKVFVGPGYSFGAPPTETIYFPQASQSAVNARGALDEWREKVGKVASGHSRAVVALSVAFSGPLLQLTGTDNFGFHFFGKSSCGKTTLLHIAASVWGAPTTVRGWRATANALEASAAMASDGLLCLDEIGAVDAKEAGPAIYQLFNGVAKGRARVDGTLRNPKTWRVAALSSGELPMAAKVAENGRQAMAGQSVRMVDIPADAGRGFGCFDHGDDKGDAGSIANALKMATTGAFGVAGPEFVRRVVADGVESAASDCNAAVDAFIKSLVPGNADGQVTRVARLFGIAAVSGELATDYGLTGWSPGEAMTAARGAFSAWLERRGGVEAAEVSAAVSQVRQFFERHGAARFERLGDSDNEAVDTSHVVYNRAGYTRRNGRKQEWWCLPEVFRKEICSGFEPTAVARLLAERGMLRTQSSGLQCNVRIEGKTFRAYVITAKIMEGMTDAD